MPDIDQTITYQTEDGDLAEMTFTTTARGMTAVTKNPGANVSPWLPKREEFCRLVAEGREPVEAYAEAYGCQEPITCASGSSRLMADTDVILRVHQLKQPVVRQLKKRITYNLEKALEECETASTLAYAKGDAKTILKAVELKARLVKIIGADDINVNHRFGMLDDASTDVLLAMRAQLEHKQTKRPSVTATVLEGTVEEKG